MNIIRITLFRILLKLCYFLLPRFKFQHKNLNETDISLCTVQRKGINVTVAEQNSICLYQTLGVVEKHFRQAQQILLNFMMLIFLTKF